MSFTKSGMNLTGLNDMTPLTLNVSDFTPSNIIDTGIETLNTTGGIWAVAIIFVGMYILFMWTLSENSPFANFKYSYLRGSLLALILVNLISITMISAGIIYSFRLVAIFIILNVINTMMVLALDN